MKMLTVMDWSWSEMLWVALISICLVFVVLVALDGNTPIPANMVTVLVLLEQF